MQTLEGFLARYRNDALNSRDVTPSSGTSPRNLKFDPQMKKDFVLATRVAKTREFYELLERRSREVAENPGKLISLEKTRLSVELMGN